MLSVVEKRICLSSDQADRLSRLAQTQQVSEDRVVEKALDILFSLTELLDDRGERQGWSFTSEASLERIWDNDADSAYDNWRELYEIPAR